MKKFRTKSKEELRTLVRLEESDCNINLWIGEDILAQISEDGNFNVWKRDLLKQGLKLVIKQDDGND